MGPKALAFSIERIMSKSSEPRWGSEERSEGRKLLSFCSPIPYMIPLQPLSYDLHTKALMNYSELWRSSFRACPGLKQPVPTHESRVVKPQVVHQAVSVPSCASLYYLNYQQSELLVGPWFSGPQAQSPLLAHHRLLLLDHSKLSGSDRLPTPQYPHKEHLPGQLDHIVKENQVLSAEKNCVKAHGKVSGTGTGADGKHKNFTCEVCGKVIYLFICSFIYLGYSFIIYLFILYFCVFIYLCVFLFGRRFI